MRACLSRFLVLVAALVFAGTAAAQSPDPRWPGALVIGTASPGGVYHSYGEGLARILTLALNLPVTARPTDGPSQNLALLESGDIQLAFVTLGTAMQGWNGTGEWTNGRTYRAARAIFPMYDSPFQFAVRPDSPIQSVADLAGKRVGVGPRLGTAGVYVPAIMRALKIEPNLVQGEYSDLAWQFEQGQLDALAVAGGAPFPILTELGRSGGLRFLPLSDAQMTSLRLSMPELGASTVAPYMYPSLTAPYRTLGMYNFAVAHRDLPDNLVYAILEAVFANQGQLADLQRAAAETLPRNYTRNTFLPFHPGASAWLATRTNAGIAQGD